MNTGNKLDLADRGVSIYSFCWGEVHTKLSLKAMTVSMSQASFEKAVLISDYEVELPEGISFEKVRGNINKNNFGEMFTREVERVMTGAFCLNVQYDSCIIDSEKWTDKFLEYDYIGAPWPKHIVEASDMAAKPVDNYVGNGGFSIRSRKFIENAAKLPTLHKNEDLNACVLNFHEMKKRRVTFAPVELAKRFSAERPLKDKDFDPRVLFTYDSFGFHGNFNTAGMELLK